MDRVLALHAGSRGFDSHQGNMSEIFFRFNRPGCPHPVSSELEISRVSEWRSVIVVSLNVSGGVRLIKPAKLYMCTQNTTNTKRTNAPTALGNVRQWFRTAEPLRERRYENWNTYTHTHIAFSLMCQPRLETTMVRALIRINALTPWWWMLKSQPSLNH